MIKDSKQLQFYKSIEDPIEVMEALKLRKLVKYTI